MVTIFELAFLQYGEDVAELLITRQTDTPHASRWIQRPSPPAGRCSGWEPPRVRPPHRCMRGRTWRGWLASCGVWAWPPWAARPPAAARWPPALPSAARAAPPASALPRP